MGYFNKVFKDVTSVVKEAHQYGNGVKTLAHVDEEGTIVIDFIKVPTSLRRQGIGSNLLEEYKTIADVHKVPIKLLPSSDFGTPSTALFMFYTHNGFFLQGDYFWYNK